MEGKHSYFKVFLCKILSQAVCEICLKSLIGNHTLSTVIAFMFEIHQEITRFFFNWDSIHSRLNSHYKALQEKALQEKEAQKDYSILEVSLERTFS